MTPFIIAVYGFGSIAAAIAALRMARHRRRNGQAWAFWSFLFPPVAYLLYRQKPLEQPMLAVAVKRGKDDLAELL